jgi:hypothetical protein
MRRLRAAVPVLVGVISSLWLPPLLLVWAAMLVWRRLRDGSWGVTLAFLSRSGRRSFVAISAVGIAGVTAAYSSQLSGHGGAGVAPVIGGVATVGLLALVALDVVLGASIVVADAATRRSRSRRDRRR